MFEEPRVLHVVSYGMPGQTLMRQVLVDYSAVAAVAAVAVTLWLANCGGEKACDRNAADLPCTALLF